MGNCCGTEENDRQNEEVNERTHLLGSGGRRRNEASNSESNDGASGKNQGPLQKTDEHRALSNILDQTVRNIIDVTQLEHAGTHDYTDRVKRYSDKLVEDPSSTLKPTPFLGKFKDCSNADKMLNAQTLSATEYQFITEASVACYNAVQTIAVVPRDDLLVKFKVNT